MALRYRLVASVLVAVGFAAPSYLRAENLVFVLDASGSMWGQLDGVTKIETARQVLSSLLSDLPSGTKVGFVSYGDQREGDCADVSVVSALGEVDAASLVERLKSIRPKGKTPIASSLERAGQLLEGATDGQIVLISDGLETCGGDPCTAAAALAERGVATRIHVVGFDVDEETRRQLRCVSDAGGGRYFDARNTKGFEEAISEVRVEVNAPREREPGLEAYWSFDACDARDEFRRYDGEVYGDPLCVDGVSGKALRFDGRDDYVRIVSESIGNLGQEATVAFWFRPGGALGRIVEKDTGNFWVFAGSERALELYLRGSSGFGSPDATMRVDPLPDTSLDGWHFVVMRKRAGLFELFVDGKLVEQGNTNVVAISTAATLNFGRSEYWKAQYYGGDLDEVRIFSRAIPDDEVAIHFESARPARP